jgi:hypothetical protein
MSPDCRACESEVLQSGEAVDGQVMRIVLAFKKDYAKVLALARALFRTIRNSEEIATALQQYWRTLQPERCKISPGHPYVEKTVTAQRRPPIPPPCSG